MPAHYAHLLFGQKVLAALRGPVGEVARRDRYAFLAGLQGPDILFYYHPLSSNPVKREGDAIHDRPGTVFFRQAAQVLGRRDTPGGRSYLAGFMCHYMLDSACHPLVERGMEAAGVSHTQLETELDRDLLVRRGKDPFRGDEVRDIQPSGTLAETIAPFYPGIKPRQIRAALESMKRCLALSHTPSAVVRGAALWGVRLAGCYEGYQGIFLRPQADPACAGPVELLERALEETVAPAAAQVEGYFRAVDRGEPLDGRLSLDFGGKGHE